MKKGTCKHFTGVQNETCDAGMKYDDFKPLPCITRLLGDKPRTCNKYEEPSDADISAFQDMLDASLERYRKAAPTLMKLRKKYKGKSWQGIIDCPICNGRLHISIAGYNGHMHGHCETDDCLSWME